jgi:hypothetical protein
VRWQAALRLQLCFVVERGIYRRPARAHKPRWRDAKSWMPQAGALPEPAWIELFVAIEQGTR